MKENLSHPNKPRIIKSYIFDYWIMVHITTIACTNLKQSDTFDNTFNDERERGCIFISLRLSICTYYLKKEVK